MKEMVDKEVVAEDVNLQQEQVETPCEQECDDTMSDGEAQNADTLADGATAPAEAMTEEQTDWRDKYLRLQAEFDNYRKRTLKEKMDLVENGGRDVLSRFITVRDDVQRAVTAMEKSDDIEALRGGVNLIANKFVETLKQKNVVEMDAKGKDFDPDFYEAVANSPAGEENKGKVIDVVEAGYMLNDKVLRFAKVVVGE